jgi:hypothetical protein
VEIRKILLMKELKKGKWLLGDSLSDFYGISCENVIEVLWVEFLAYEITVNPEPELRSRCRDDSSSLIPLSCCR